MAKAFQDRPPAGGYGPIEWERQFAKRPFSGAKWFIALLGLKATYTTYYFMVVKPKSSKEKLEINDASIATVPFYVAESDRTYLRHLRALRDEERELMKDVPGWEVGTLYGIPVWNNVRNRFIMPRPFELEGHSLEQRHGIMLKLIHRTIGHNFLFSTNKIEELKEFKAQRPQKLDA